MTEESLDPHEISNAIFAFQTGRDPEAAFALIFERYFRPVRRFFGRKGLPPDLCLDLTQEAFLGVYRGLATYRPEARFEAWLYTVAQNIYLKHWRSRHTGKRHGVEVEVTSAPHPVAREDPLDSVLDRERQHRLRAAVATLPEQMRRCLTLRLYQGWSYRQIATLAGISEETVKAHLFQGRRRLRGLLAESSEALS